MSAGDGNWEYKIAVDHQVLQHRVFLRLSSSTVELPGTGATGSLADWIWYCRLGGLKHVRVIWPVVWHHQPSSHQTSLFETVT